MTPAYYCLNWVYFWSNVLLLWSVTWFSTLHICISNSLFFKKYYITWTNLVFIEIWIWIYIFDIIVIWIINNYIIIQNIKVIIFWSICRPKYNLYHIYFGLFGDKNIQIHIIEPYTVKIIIISPNLITIVSYFYFYKLLFCMSNRILKVTIS